MNTKKCLCTLLALLFCFGSEQVVLAEGEMPIEKKEITLIFNMDYLTGGEMLAVNDLVALDAVVSVWESRFNNRIVCFSDDFDEADLILDTLNYSQIKIDTVGNYTVTAKLKLAEEFNETYSISDALCTLKIPVRVSDPAVFEIWISSVFSNRIHLEWLYEDRDAELLYTSSENPLSDQELQDATWSIYKEDWATLRQYFYSIQRNKLILNHYYYFRLKSGEIVSNIIGVVDDGSKVEYADRGGDRDGGDGEVNPPPDYYQPPPESPLAETLVEETKPKPKAKPNDSENTEDLAVFAPAQEADQPEETFQEFFGETKDIISGTRLKLMLENSGTARFSKQGITVTLPKETLSNLNILDNDQITVIIERLNDTTFYFDFQINGQSVPSLASTHIMLPFVAQHAHSELTILDEEGHMYPVNYDGTQGICSFYLNTTGRFFIDERVVPLAAQSSAANNGAGWVIVLSISGGILAGLTIWFYRKRVRR